MDPKKLNISTAMNKADLIKELQKAQRWLSTAERNKKKAEKQRRADKVTAGLEGIEARRTQIAQELQGEVDSLRQALTLSDFSGASHILSRVVFMPGAVNAEPDLRLTVDLVLHSQTGEWVGGFAVGYGSYINNPGKLSPFLLRGDDVDWGFESYEQAALKIKGKSVRVGEHYAYSSKGKLDEGRESYRVTQIIPLLSGVSAMGK
jgi:hypothetical protein